MAIRYAPRATIPPPVGGYQVIPAPGGAYHVYANGRKVFVKASAATPAAAPAAAAAAPAPVDYTPGGGGDPAPVAQPVAAPPKARTEYAPDAQYFAWRAQAQAKQAQSLTANREQGGRNLAGYQEALRQMAFQQPRDEGGAKTGFNQSGLFYSTALGNQLGDIARTYAERRGKTQTSYDDSERARLAARAAIEQGLPLEDAAQYAASIDRQIAADTGAADAGVLVPETQVASVADAAYGNVGAPAAVKVPTAARAPAAAKFKTIVKNNKVYHRYATGRTVYVRPASTARKPRRR